jgi:hypothetical protein
VAATLTDAGELTFVSFPIEKTETTEDGDLVVFGKATDGSVDHDQQVVLPSFAGPAISKWLETGGNLRVQHSAQRDPAGVGLEVKHDGDATWVRSLVVEPVAKRLVSKGALRAYSVGIARPTIERDPTGKARGGIISGGEIVEISLVDRPANKSCGIQLVKSADDGTPEYVGKVFGSDDDIQKALGGDVAEKAVSTDFAPADMSRFGFPDDLSVTFTPNDMARLMQTKIVEKHYAGLASQAAGVEKRDVATAERRSLAGEGNALPDGSYPIKNTGDLHNAAVLARSGHGDVAAARRLIARRAGELGVANPLDESDDVTKGTGGGGGGGGADTALVVDQGAVQSFIVKEAEPDVTKDPEEAKDKPVKKAKKKKKLPPWLNKPQDDSDGKDDSCKQDHAHTEKCHTDPAQAAGVSASPMQPAPVGELVETPAPDACKADPTPASAAGAVAEHMDPAPRHREPDGAPMEAFEKDAKLSDGDNEAPARLEAATGMKMLAADPEVAVLLRFKALGVDEDLGRLHDMTCPAFHPEDVAKHHPFADLPGLIDSGAWQKKTLAAAAGPLDHALKMQEIWQAALLLKTADMADLNDWRLELHKAFRDANPGPGSYPTPGQVSPQRYHRPVLTDGRPANAVNYDGPNSAPQVASGPPNAQNFDRPPLSSMQESPSPSFMKGGGAEYPSEQGVPVQLTYAQMQKEQTRMALVRMHDHLGRQFPEVCPLNTADSRPLRGVQPEHKPVPPIAGIGKGGTIPAGPGDAVPAMLDNGYVVPAPVAAAFKATPEDGDFFGDADIYKSFKKMRKKLGKKVLSGSMTVDEARAKLGRQFAQKAAEPDAPVAAEKAVTAELIKSAVAEALQAQSVPLEAATIESFDPSPAIEAAVTKAVTPLLEKIQQQDTKLAETQRVIDAIADQPDPSTAAFSGLAFNPVQKSRRPAAVPDQAEYAARAQEMVRRNLQSTYTTHSNPYVREAASEALAKLGVPEVAS